MLGTDSGWRYLYLCSKNIDCLNTNSYLNNRLNGDVYTRVISTK
jgi:hypothetical protein